MAPPFLDPGKWVFNYVRGEERVTWRVKASIPHLAQDRSPKDLDEAIRGGDFDALLCRHPTEVCRLITINEASNKFSKEIGVAFRSLFSDDYNGLKSVFNLSLPHDAWSENFCDWITLITLQQNEGWVGYQKTFYHTGGFALLEEIESVLRENLEIWKVWDCHELRENLISRKGALFHFLDTVQKRKDYPHEKFLYDPNQTIQSMHATSS